MEPLPERTNWDTLGLPGNSDGKESACTEGDLGSIPGSGRSPWRRACLPTPIFLLEHSMDRGGGLQSMGSQSQTCLSD